MTEKEKDKNKGANKLAINNAFSLIGAGGNFSSDKKEETTQAPILPTAKTRKALDYLIRSTPEQIREDYPSVKPLLQDLFNWDGNNHVNKPLLKAFGDAVSTPLKYPHAVELTGFLAGAAPMLEPDQIARLYSLVNEVDTAFAPTRYTMQLNERLNAVFGSYSPQAKERLLHSLWTESHSGRWWNLTAGLDFNENDEQIAQANNQLEHKSADEIFIEIKGSFEATMNLSRRAANQAEINLVWNERYQEEFSKLPMSKEAAVLAEDYSSQLQKGEYVHPDIAVYLSALPWLAPLQRPESPVTGLLKFLSNVIDQIDNYKKPKKPREFSELFPNVHMQAGAFSEYPVYEKISRLDGQKIAGHKVKVIRNRVSLAENAKFMGNCTLSYSDRLKKGSQVMLYTDDGRIQHNISMHLNNNTWRLGEINARFNQTTRVDSKLREYIRSFVQKMPPVEPSFQQYLDYIKESSGKDSFTYNYSLY